ncbi:GlsB/YeaQ/YmgE family stress response membrane protein [Sphingomonas bacterium]|uniref:GlsB/YeaQ/YmgE family stress response membrane protein n=1 Tax=Sphingomonas bacterium TaxID=1895847 RepID=UPI0026237D25|nr:GlsB/YeaQ/YmgE family stress response membrane protein [Sphingomonas bacterium]
MNIIVWLVVGGVAGWLASLVMARDGQQGILLNVVVGIVGAVIAGWLFGAGINDAITVMTFVYSVIGAIILLAIINLINRGRVR